MSGVKKALVSYAVEQALLGNGGAKMIKKVSEDLNHKYSCKLENCFETPNYINQVLKQSYEKKHREIVKAIEDNLEEFTSNKDIKKFLLKIK